ncbi:MAG: hypothetical protein ACJAVN_000011 [Roseivirga sp.]|jgi:hypothetical protein
MLFAFVSTHAIAQNSQESQDSLQQESFYEKFPRTRFLNIEYGQSLDRGFRSELFGENFQEGDIKSQQNFSATTNIPLYEKQNWSLLASGAYQVNSYEFQNIGNLSSINVFEQNGVVDFHNFSVGLSSTYFSTLFNTPIIYMGSITADGNDDGFQRIKGLVGFSFILKQTEQTTITLGAIGFLDPSSQIPFSPTFSYNHSFKNSNWELDFILPERLLLRRSVGENSRVSFGSSLGYSGFYVDVNDQIIGDVFAYSQIEIKTGIMYEHRINDYLIGTFQGGVQNFIGNQSTEKGEPAQDFIYKNKQDAAKYFQIGISIDPFAKRKK